MEEHGPVVPRNTSLTAFPGLVDTLGLHVYPIGVPWATLVGTFDGASSSQAAKRTPPPHISQVAPGDFRYPESVLSELRSEPPVGGYGNPAPLPPAIPVLSRDHCDHNQKSTWHESTFKRRMVPTEMKLVTYGNK
ncbi:hypothetical protein K438DRAFT_1772220 [Mycena galopus ATCC 62051]|nr:hypothetical protein K438DRAFT_1772220 [Mycena galopus ATCC 62051]